MIGYNPEQQHLAVNWRHALSGASSSCFTRFLCQPFDVIKIRFQLQIEPISRSSKISKYRSIPQTVGKVVSDEGIRALWKGHISSQILSVIYGVIQFSSFELYTQLVWNVILLNENNKESALKYQPMIHFFCGAMSGFSATLMGHPFDVVRTRLIAQAEPKTYRTTFSAFKIIATTDGYKGFYRGLVPTVLQIAPFTGTQFAVYNVCNKVWVNLFEQNFDKSINKFENNNKPNIKLRQTLACGAISGFAAKLLVYPLDLVKKRLQVEGFQYARTGFGDLRSYSGTVDCLSKILREEKFFAYYKGLSPSLLKAAVTSALSLTFYESIVSMLDKK